jgi:branched-chain amino acid transport system ATP-binding protein
MLSVENIEVYYGKNRAIQNVSLRVEEGQLVTLMGANGTGKTTILNCISGFLKQKRGSINYRGKRIDKFRAEQVVQSGISQVSQNRDLFSGMSVVDNLILGGILEKDKKKLEENFQRVYQWFPVLRNREKQAAGSLSGGEQQMLAIGRALMLRPSCILLDEPTTGLAPLIVKEITKIIGNMVGEGMSVLWVSQDAIMATALAQYYYILRDGKVVAEGETSNLPQNKKGFFKNYYI